LKRLSAFTVNLSFTLEPVYGILLAFIVFKENKLLSVWFYIGFTIIATAIILHAMLLLKQEQKSFSRTA
jgi:drug/metabolite transporter (DMT)-like permease